MSADSQKYLINQTYDFDFDLENLKLCYQQNEIKNILMKFSVNDIIINEDKKENNYSNILDNIDNNLIIFLEFSEKKRGQL